MKYLRILNKINTYALGIFLLGFMLGIREPFEYEYEDSMELCAVILFFITFICGAITFYCADKADVNRNGLYAEDSKLLPKRRMIFWAVVCAVEIILLLCFVQSSILIWTIGVLFFSYIFAAFEYIVIPEIEASKKFKLSLPGLFLPVPFVFFISAELFVSDHFSEETITVPAMIVFAMSGLMMSFLMWYSSYVVDEDNKTILKNRGIISFLKGETKKISLSEIEYIEKRRFRYHVYHRKGVLKIERIFSYTKRFEELAEKRGIEIREKTKEDLI